MAKSNSYIKEELIWLEERASEIKTYIDQNPYHKMKDRVKSLMTIKGPMDRVVANIETQQKSQREALKDYALLLEAIDKMRQMEENKPKEARGEGEVPYRMQQK